MNGDPGTAGGCSAPASVPAARGWGPCSGARATRPCATRRDRRPPRILGQGLRACAHLRRDDWTASAGKPSAHATQYFGEFAFELLAVVPYAYWLYSPGAARASRSPHPTPGRSTTSRPTTRSVPSRDATCRSPSIPSAAAAPSATTAKRFRESSTPPLASAPVQGGLRRQPVPLGARALHRLQQVLATSSYLWHRGPVNFIGTARCSRSSAGCGRAIRSSTCRPRAGGHRQRPPGDRRSRRHRGGGARLPRRAERSSSSMPNTRI